MRLQVGEFSSSAHLCPTCYRPESREIVYGDPSIETVLRAEEGLVYIGGCMPPPNWRGELCRRCEHDGTAWMIDRYGKRHVYTRPEDDDDWPDAFRWRPGHGEGGPE